MDRSIKITAINIIAALILSGFVYDKKSSVALAFEPDFAQCGVTQDMHPFSTKVLDNLTSGVISKAEFLRYFSLPNSSYISIGQCVANLTQAVTTADSITL